MIKNCSYCNNEFEAIRVNGMYCSRTCNSAAFRKRNPTDSTIRNLKCRLKSRTVINDIKIKTGCIDCGYNKHAIALDFDHVRGIKEFDIAQTEPLSLVLEEIKKCEVVCANCHRIRTLKRSIDKSKYKEHYANYKF